MAKKRTKSESGARAARADGRRAGKASKKSSTRTSKAPTAKSPAKSSAKPTSAPLPRRSPKRVTAVGRSRATKAAAAAHPAAPSSEEIALRAFLKWQERGGDELSNWIDAEQELHAERLGGARAGAGRTGAGRAGATRNAATPSTSRKRRRHASSPR